MHIYSGHKWVDQLQVGIGMNPLHICFCIVLTFWVTQKPMKVNPCGHALCRWTRPGVGGRKGSWLNALWKCQPIHTVSFLRSQVSEFSHSNAYRARLPLQWAVSGILKVQALLELAFLKGQADNKWVMVKERRFMRLGPWERGEKRQLIADWYSSAFAFVDGASVDGGVMHKTIKGSKFSLLILCYTCQDFIFTIILLSLWLSFKSR